VIEALRIKPSKFISKRDSPQQTDNVNKFKIRELKFGIIVLERLGGGNS